MIRTIQMSRRIAVLLALSALALAGALTLPISAHAAEGPFSEPPFEIEGFTATATDELGNLFTQAGGHPYQAESGFHFPLGPVVGGNQYPSEPPKETIVELPPGFIGNPQAMPQCTLSQLNLHFLFSGCPAASRVGTLNLNLGFTGLDWDVYNLVPERGYAAEFGVNILGNSIVFYGRLRSGSDYGLTVTVPGIPKEPPTSEYRLTFFGTPAAQNGSGAPAVPFLTNPTNCAASEVTRIKADSWQHPGVWRETSTTSPNVTGCDRVPFTPSIAVTPENTVAGAPSGYDVDLSVPQNQSAGVAQAALKKAVVTLPAGVSVSPSAASGLGACTPAQVALHSSEAANCPDSSKIGTVEIDTPLLNDPLKGAVYLASQGDNPFNSLLAVYIAVSDPQTGIVIKLAGQVAPNPVTGQLTATFDNNPQLPFNDLKLDFNTGPRAPLVNPVACGTYTTTTELTPYTGTPPATPSSSFQINQGCASPQPFAPGFVAGMVSPQAGTFSPFTATFSRSGDEQTFGALSVKAPPGLTGVLTGVPLCPEPQASQGTCGAGSLIGHTTVAAGPGSNPFTLGGQVFLTGPYKGAPFGLSVVVPAVAGPLNLGTVVVRASIAVDPTTAGLTITSDPLPQILQGIPLDLRSVNVTIDRPNFTLNPTDCSPLAIGGVVQSGQNTNVSVSSPFRVGSCAGLKFEPRFSASTSGKTSKANGASLSVKLTYPSTPEANLASVKVDLPKALPSRLKTLQKACLARVFEANPATCPAESVVGRAKATTSILPVPLEGPAYFVSHGGEAFPSLIVVLQGYGVTVDLVGTTFISKAGITSSTFKTVPDVPVGMFELNLPEGKYSALAANANLCTSKLAMPTAFVGQNGAEIHQSTPIAVTGCAKTKALTPAQKLAKALKACKRKAKVQRAGCEKQAAKEYAPLIKGKKRAGK
jgi:hypothetical protein